MNAASRLVHHSALSRHFVLTYLLTRRQIMLFMLILTILFSAWGIVYVTHVSRVLYSTYQHNLLEQDHLRVERSQLLLERSASMLQAKTQDIAENKLGMVVPDSKSTVIIHQ